MSNVELVNDSAELADFRIAQMFTGDAAVALVAALESAPGGGLTDEGAVSHRRPSLLTPRAVPEMCPMRSTSASVQHRDGQPLVAQGPQQPGHPRRRLATTRPAEQGGGDRSTVRVDASRVTTPASVSKGTRVDRAAKGHRVRTLSPEGVSPEPALNSASTRRCAGGTESTHRCSSAITAGSCSANRGAAGTTAAQATGPDDGVRPVVHRLSGSVPAARTDFPNPTQAVA
jgi:hypothetical protein